MPAGSADNPAARAVAIAQALEALVAARHDDATARFDNELSAAVDAGRLDEETARTLRWWQRASVRGAQSYLADLLPGVLHADDAAQRRSRAHTDLAAASWQAATQSAARLRASTQPNADGERGDDSGADRDSGPGSDGAPGSDSGPTDASNHPADAPLRVRLVAVPRHAARTGVAGSTAAPSGKDTSGDDHSATTA